MEDIAPDLLLRIRASFQKRMEESSQIQEEELYGI